jgi:hypothetical protein
MTPHAFRMLTAALAVVACLTFSPNARAEMQLKQIHFPDNDSDIAYLEYYSDSEDSTKYFILIVWKDGMRATLKPSDSNPGPDDPPLGKGDRDSRIDLAKQGGGGKWIPEREFWDSPLGQKLGRGGKGPETVHNPGDDAVGGSPGDPSVNKEKLGRALIIDKTGDLGSGKGGGFQVNAGSPGEQIKKPGGPGGHTGGGSDDDDDDKGSSPPDPGYGPAELVDPLGPFIKPVKTTGGNDRRNRDAKKTSGKSPPKKTVELQRAPVKQSVALKRTPAKQPAFETQSPEKSSFSRIDRIPLNGAAFSQAGGLRMTVRTPSISGLSAGSMRVR